ncbi:hypothetical protein PAEAM_56280 [Paenibacillus sp. GM1FR]|uniref:hypothetical protein n=1 Tax=Paenibacillus sp. GM1FR TaxID=2059267 RepID=UPI000C274809|nr:hypothetical protein [Paenibacillus sp. GM1FR]PJN50016.1 hypothetical protein PAEAM_56280 [Paenibacillus sp. GM1FR]
MKFTKLVEDLEMIIEYKIRDAIGETISELNKRNMLTASFASDNIITSGFMELNNQIINNIEEFSKLKLLKKAEIIVLKKQINIIIENQSILLIDEATKSTSYEPTYLKQEHLKKESKRIMNIQIERLLREKKQKTISFWWDLSKIAFTAIVAGFIGGYIKDIYFK